LLTHTSVLPDAGNIFQSDPGARHVQGFLPGTHFHYCNLGFHILGQLIEKLDGTSWYQCVQTRILKPMGMTATAAVITIQSSARSAIGYQPYFDDWVYPRQGRLVATPPEVVDSPAGSIASTPGDMARYTRMLLNGGVGPKGRIVSADGFTRMSTPYIKAPEFSSTASYGYGIAVDTLDGHRILRHTGGMSCFASSVHVDLDGGYAAFASINAMQGYRPTAVTQYAIQLMRADRTKPLPAAEPLKNPEEIDNAAEYAGSYKAGDGKELVFKADGKKLMVMHGTDQIVLQRGQDDSFLSTVQGVYSDYSLVFGREKTIAGNVAQLVTTPLVVEIGYGSDWYTNEKYQGSREFSMPAQYASLIGRYRTDAGDDAHVFVRKGQLWLEDARLTPIGASLFRVGEDAWSPDTVEFPIIVDGKARLMRAIGEECWRVEVGS
jgi:D-alanyl-D-alanine carboxypeptidase